MPIITINPDQLLSTYNTLNQQAHLLMDEEFKLRKSFASLDMAWQGKSAAEFMLEAETLHKLYRVLIQDLFILSQRIHREADRWEESDQVWVQEYRTIAIRQSIFGG